MYATSPRNFAKEDKKRILLDSERHVPFYLISDFGRLAPLLRNIDLGPTESLFSWLKSYDFYVAISGSVIPDVFSEERHLKKYNDIDILGISEDTRLSRMANELFSSHALPGNEFTQSYFNYTVEKNIISDCLTFKLYPQNKIAEERKKAGGRPSPIHLEFQYHPDIKEYFSELQRNNSW